MVSTKRQDRQHPGYENLALRRKAGRQAYNKVKGLVHLHMLETSLRPATKAKNLVPMRTYQNFALTETHFSERVTPHPLAFSVGNTKYPHSGLKLQEQKIVVTPKPNPGLGMRPVPLKAVRKAPAVNLPPAMDREHLLLKERGELLDRENAGSLSEMQATRLHQVEALLDRLEDQDPVEQEADRRLARTGDKLDEILALLRSLPRKVSEDTAR